MVVVQDQVHTYFCNASVCGHSLHIEVILTTELSLLKMRLQCILPWLMVHLSVKL